MKKYLSTVPEILKDRFANQHGDWQAFLRQNCPVTTTALDYADSAGVTAEYKRYSDTGTITTSGGHAEAYIFANKVLCGYRDSYDLFDLLPTSAHEIKHINQFRREQGSGSWQYAAGCLGYALHIGEKNYPDKFTIIPAIDKVLSGLIHEIDSATYDTIVCDELVKTGASSRLTPDRAAGFTPQDLHRIILGEDHTFDFYTKLYKQHAAQMGSMLKSCEEKGWKLPEFEIVPITTTLNRNATFGFWHEAGHRPPLAGPDGIKMVDQLRDKILASPIFAEISEISSEWLVLQTATRPRITGANVQPIATKEF
jgi:hypothetical protein